MSQTVKRERGITVNRIHTEQKQMKSEIEWNESSQRNRKNGKETECIYRVQILMALYTVYTIETAAK